MAQIEMHLPICQGDDWNPAERPGGGTCGACGAALVTTRWFCRAPAGCRTLYMENHLWGDARSAAMRRDEMKCRKCPAWADEVNHIAPRRGRGYRRGCHHHLDNLESLCHRCHVIVTAEQRKVAG